MISIILPSRERAKRAYETARKWIDNAGCDIEFILSIDSDDPQRADYFNMFRNLKIEVNPNRSAIDAINNGAKVAKGNILIQIAEDFDCPLNWGAHILDEVGSKTDWILKTQDGIQDWIITLPIMDRVYYNRFGYVYHPDYLHLFTDTEMSCVADLTGRRLTSKIIFNHLHYSTGKNVKDAISIKADSTWAQGEKLFIERYKKNFDLGETAFKITNQGYLNWIKGKL